jgi:hypothetical protein
MYFRFQFNVQANDAGIPSKRTVVRATVNISWDFFAPEFQNFAQYQTTIDYNALPGQILDTISAIDNDDNDEVSFKSL